MADNRQVYPGQVDVLVLEGVDPGLVGTLGLAIMRLSDDLIVKVRSTGGIEEMPAASGVYNYKGWMWPSVSDLYQVTWDAAGESWIEIVEVTPRPEIEIAPSTEYTPTLSLVGSLLRSRTRNAAGVETGTFGSDTRPTDQEATDLLALAATRVSSVVGADVPDGAREEVAFVTALYGAMLIELTYYPEQIATRQSPYSELKALFDENMVNVQKTVSEAGVDQEAAFEELIGPGMPQFSFPANEGGLLGWRTTW